MNVLDKFSFVPLSSIFRQVTLTIKSKGNLLEYAGGKGKGFIKTLTVYQI